MSDEPGPPGIW